MPLALPNHIYFISNTCQWVISLLELVLLQEVGLLALGLLTFVPGAGPRLCPNNKSHLSAEPCEGTWTVVPRNLK